MKELSRTRAYKRQSRIGTQTEGFLDCLLRKLLQEHWPLGQALMVKGHFIGAYLLKQELHICCHTEPTWKPYEEVLLWDPFYGQRGSEELLLIQGRRAWRWQSQNRNPSSFSRVTLSTVPGSILKWEEKRGILGRGHSTCKGPEAQQGLPCLARNSGMWNARIKSPSPALCAKGRVGFQWKLKLCWVMQDFPGGWSPPTGLQEWLWVEVAKSCWSSSFWVNEACVWARGENPPSSQGVMLTPSWDGLKPP